LLIVRHFAERCAVILGLTSFRFSGFRMASGLHHSLASVLGRRRTTMCIINETPQIHFRQTTTSTPEQFVAGLTDFGPGRSTLFRNSADEYLKVHHLGPSEADVTEGSGGIWERLHYDWSDPNRVVLTTTDSNVWSRLSSYIYTFAPQPNGTTDIDLVIVRDGMNFKGRVLGLALRTIGRRFLERAFENSVKGIEARNVQTDHEIKPLHISAARSRSTQCACAVVGAGSCK
jgi:hypothetical protein